jgi:hypothetical protein
MKQQMGVVYKINLKRKDDLADVEWTQISHCCASVLLVV